MRAICSTRTPESSRSKASNAPRRPWRWERWSRSGSPDSSVSRDGNPEEATNRARGLRRSLVMDEVADVRDLHELRVREQGRQVPLRLDRSDVVLLGGDEEDRHIDVGSEGSDVV